MNQYGWWGTIVAGGVILLLWSGLLSNSEDGLLRSEKHFPREVSFGERVFSVEIAATDEEKTKGLGDRDTLCPTCAMLFIFDERERYAFGMRGMRFPLDIVWLSGDRVVFVVSRVTPESPEIFTPPVAADRVLEGNAGVFDGLKVGERIRYGK